MKYDNVFIIHREKDINRNLSLLIKEYPNYKVIEPVPIKDNVSQLICMWSKKKENKQAVISLYETNILLLEHIVKEKLNKVLILEDDAIPVVSTCRYNKDSLINFFYHTKWNDRYIGCVSNYYHSWENTKILLYFLKQYRRIKKDKHRSFDIELDYMKNKYELNFSYYNYFSHNMDIPSTLGNNKYMA